MSKLLGLILLFIRLSWQQDPLNNFCRRWGHQTAVIDEKLWIDGGQVNWTPFASNPQNVSNTWLLYNDLSNDSSLGMPQLHATNYKNATIPDVTGGILWEDNINKRFYLYGGEYLNDGLSPSAVNLWSFDAIYNYWVSFGAPSVTAQISGVSYAGHVAVSEVGQGFALGGWMSNATVPNWSGGPVASSALIKYDMGSNTWTNNSGPDSTPRAEGAMVYIPASDHGLLIYFGGVTAPYYNSSIIESPMDTIYVYDITSSKWYSQTATGDIPADRRRFCAGATWAQDKSSYNIYIYGGLGFGANSTGFDDLYILSLPSFTWIKWYEGTTPSSFHHSMTCNVVNNAQMLVIGGTFPASDQCDSSNVWGTHNVDMGKVSGNMWEIFKPNLTTYNVPPEIISVVGGSTLGGATATAPAAGFQSQDLSVYFTEHASAAVRTATRAIPTTTSTNTSSSSSKLSSGAIAGIAVGGAVFLLALLLGGCCLVRRYRRRRLPQQPPAAYPAPDYSALSQTPQSPYTPGGHYQQYQAPVPVQQHYQLPAVVPVELAGNHYQLDPTKNSGIQQLSAEQQATYQDWQGSPTSSPPPQHISPSQSVRSPHPSLHSPHPSYFTPVDSNSNTMYSSPGSAISPAPTYSSAQRQTRKPVPPPNQTYYSP
ncbi:hypothetical protein EG329_008682 [Mollisiaceae sp. DMI_Dod_QoI]|nr:hypothetical protein EG329_008682 [Helotiales sp. DMI_Dod_QoI]